MEYVCKQLLEYSSNYEILVYNLPIREEKQTLGEVDFILRDLETEKIIHVELTYKFYIIEPDITEPLHQLIGPNKRDAFIMKMEKIKNKQFALLHSKAGSKALADKGIIVSDITHKACFKAQLFKPFKQDTVHLHLLNKNCIMGYWLRFFEFNTSTFSQHHFYIPTKSEWVIEPHLKVNWLTYSKSLAEVHQRLTNKNSPLVWLKKGDTEFEKFFIVWW
jgi:hypothetical protein